MGEQDNPEQSVLESQTWGAVGLSDVGMDLSAMNNAPPPKSAKKRTKTGCLTCRQRRIKCTEEKPVCAQCIKSKRECKGYTQRVIFKNPIGINGAFDSNQFLSAQVQPPPNIVPFGGGYEGPSPTQQRPAGSRHPIIAPKPTPFPAVGQPSVSGTDGELQQDSQGADGVPFYYPPMQAHIPLPMNHPGPSHIRRHSIATPASAPHEHHQGSWSGYDANDVNHSAQAAVPSPSTAEPHSNFWAHTSVKADRGAMADTVHQLNTTPGSQTSNSSWDSRPALFSPGLGQTQQQSYQQTAFLSPISSSQHYDDESDDYYDVDSDEEMPDHAQAEDSNQLSLIISSASQDERQLRSFTTHLNEPNILATYHPTLGSSPLNNPKTARIFVHFIHSSGPSLSIFERHPCDSSIGFGGPVPPAQQGLWTYTLPLKALEHPALLQGILALSSLHISFLQQAPPTVSLKHYHFALKKVGTAVGLPTRRKQIGTLAAALLLGYYEVMAAEHSKWSSHVAGSAQLVREIDWAGMTRDLRAQRRRLWTQQEHEARSGSLFANHYLNDGMSQDDPFAEKEATIDERLIGSIMGRAVNYDEFGQVEDGHTQHSYKHFTRKDIENYRIQCDLYWWYAKQDIMQAMISGNRLFMPYSQWGQCPPRAGIGRLDAIYGSTDHLWTLFARITDFGYRDRKRKLKMVKTSGSDWKPTPALGKFMARFAQGSNMRGPPPGAPPGAPTSPPDGGPVRSPPGAPQSDRSPSQGSTYKPTGGTPPMYGMIPPRGPTRLPSGFANTRNPRDVTPDQDDDSEDTTYTDAEAEWEAILAACDTFAEAVGRDFQPLPPDSTPPISTPFGPALQYRTHTVAVLWGFYFTARILLHRLHPSMPAAMMVAAGVAAPTTAEYAQIIGKIAAGIYYPQSFNLQAGSLSPTLGSSLTEMTVPIFFAGVQYSEPSQRGWTIAKLRDVARLTGWKTSNAIASGCENSWIVAAKQGRGPPYQRTRDRDGRQPYTEKVANRQNEDGSFRDDNSTERRFVAVSKSDRVHWAMGILSLEDDVLNLELEDRV